MGEFHFFLKKRNNVKKIWWGCLEATETLPIVDSLYSNIQAQSYNQDPLLLVCRIYDDISASSGEGEALMNGL